MLQAWDFHAGENFIANMHRALEETVRTLVILSPAYCTSNYCQQELASTDPMRADRSPQGVPAGAAIDENAFGPDHPNVARVVNNLGMVLKDLGDLDGAGKAFERALTIDENAFGPDHPNVATDVNNLGMVLKDLGDLAGARRRSSGRCDRRDRLRPRPSQRGHPRQQPGQGAARPGRPRRRRQGVRARAAIDEAAFGPDHPNVAIRVNNLGWCCRTSATSTAPARRSSGR